MQGLIAALSSLRDTAYLLIRVMTGIVFTFHGAQKFFVIGLGGVTGFFTKLGIPIPQITAPIIATLELVGGILLILGLFTRYLGVLFTLEFLVATYSKWVLLGAGYKGSELELLLLFLAFLFATNGPGRMSLDVQMKREI